MDGMRRRAPSALPLLILLVLAGCTNPLLDTVKGIIALSKATSGFSVSVDGTAIAPDGTVSFGSVLVNGTASKTFTITNTGGAALALTSTPAVGEAGDTAVLKVTAQPPSSVAAGESGTFAVQFAPTAPGAWATTLTIATNDPGIPTFSFTVTGTSAGPSILVYQTSESDLPNGTGAYSFPLTQVGTSSLPATFTITNTGAGTLTLTSTPAVLVSDEFSVGVQPALTALTAGAATTFTILFNPTTAVERTGTVTIASNAGTYTFQVKGTGSATPVPQILVYQATEGDLNDGSGRYHFSETLINASSTPVTFHIKNTGTANLTLDDTPYVEVPAGSGFTADCTSTTSPIATGSETTFTITFSPTSAGYHETVVSILNNTGNTYTFYIDGTCIRPVIKVKEPGGVTDITNGGTSTASFGTPGYYEPSSPVTFTIKNEGTAPLTISSVTLGGTNPDQFAISSQPSSPIAAGASSTFPVTFTCTSGGQKSATVIISSSDPVTPTFTFILTATGTGFAAVDDYISSDYSCSMAAAKGSGSYRYIFIVYRDDGGSLSFQRSIDNGVSFASTTIETGDVGKCLAMAENDGYLYLVYYDSAAHSLKFRKSAQWGTSWGNAVELDSGTTYLNDCTSCSITVAPILTNRSVYISYYGSKAAGGGCLRYVGSLDKGVSFSSPVTVDNGTTTEYIGAGTSVAGNGIYRWISYLNVNTSKLRCASSTDGSTWTIKDSIDTAYYETSITATVDNVWIAYTGSSYHMLARSTDDGLSFTCSTIDSAEMYGGHPSLKLNGSANLYLSYQTHPDSTRYGLKFTRSTDYGASWTTPLTLHSTSSSSYRTGECSSLSYYLDGATPRLFVAWCYKLSSYCLSLTRSNDNGLTW